MIKLVRNVLYIFVYFLQSEYRANIYGTKSIRGYVWLIVIPKPRGQYT